MSQRTRNFVLPFILAGLLGLIWALVLVGISKAAGPICSVNRDGSADYTTIGDALADTDCITIHIATGVYTENLTIDRNLTLQGAGATMTVIDGNGPVTYRRVISITLDQKVNITDLTIRNGFALSEINGGGGISNRGHLTITGVILTNNMVTGSHSSDIGGAISPGGVGSGSLRMKDCIVSHNTADRGGGIFFNNVLWMTNTLIYSNTARSSGGIDNYGTMTLTNVTISDNYADNGGGGIGNYGHATVVNSTVANNAGWGISNINAMTLTNTILAGNFPDNCNRDLSSFGYNLDTGETCSLNGIGDITNTTALIGGLNDNGGSSWTHSLLPGSPAIDAGSPTVCPTTDQRGMPRPTDGDGDGVATCDMGSVEYQLTITPLYLPLIRK